MSRSKKSRKPGTNSNDQLVVVLHAANPNWKAACVKN